MFVIWLSGGLGNNMFQYAFGKALHLQGFKVCFDASWHYNNDDDGINGGGKNFEFARFNLSLPINLHFNKAKFVKLNKVEKFFLAFKAQVFHKILAVDKKPWLAKYVPPHWLLRSNYKEIVDVESELLDLNLLDKIKKKNVYFQGYWQAINYFEHYQDIIRQEFTLKSSLSPENEKLRAQIVSIPNSVFLHIRRGDYLKIDWYINLDSLYYESAIKHIKRKIKNPHIFLFSNDIVWCEHEFLAILSKECKQGVKFSFVKNNVKINAIEEMELMRSCQHGIIANSTFSWWAGYLLQNPNKIIVMPAQFFHKHLLPYPVPPHPRDIIFDGAVLVNS